MSNGRSEKRIARTESVEVCLQDETRLNERSLTENVSAHGARVLMEQKLQPGQRVLVSSPKEGMHSQARIIYCQRVSEGRFAVGLELSGRVEFRQSLTNCKRQQFLTNYRESELRAYAPIFFPSPPEVSSFVRCWLHSGHFHRRKLFLWGMTSARYMSCPSLGQLTRGGFSSSIVFASSVAMEYPSKLLYLTKQAGSRQAYSGLATGPVGGLTSISV